MMPFSRKYCQFPPYFIYAVGICPLQSAASAGNRLSDGPAPHVSRRENLASCLFFLVEDGEGELRYEDRIWQLKVGDCVFIDCRHPYSTAPQPLWACAGPISFGPNLNSIYDQKYAERGGLPCFHPADSTRYRSLLEELYQIAASSDHIKGYENLRKLASLLTLLMEESWNPGAHPEKRTAAETCRR